MLCQARKARRCPRVPTTYESRTRHRQQLMGYSRPPRNHPVHFEPGTTLPLAIHQRFPCTAEASDSYPVHRQVS